MGATMFILALAAVFMVTCQADINVSDYIYWKKTDINQYHQFFPSRALVEELLTIQAAIATVNNMPTSLPDDLEKILAFPYSELETAKQLMAGTDAEGCINGISNYLDQSVNDQVEAYQDCAADAPSRLSRLNNSWVRSNTSYQASYQRALAGIDACYKTYPNKDSIDRLRSCVESMNTNYFTAANNTQSSMFPSPSMTYVQNTVIQCASSSAQAVAAKGAQFLKMLVNCAALSGTVDPTTYAEELSHWKGYNDTLADQISRAQSYNYYQVWDVEREMINYYNLQKQALEEYVIESRGKDYYLQRIYSILSDYYNTVTATSVDNPGDTGCVTDAKSVLDTVADTGANSSLTCDQKIVADTKELLAEIYNNFQVTNDMLTSIGNVAILNCISQGYAFAPNTVQDCFKLTSSGFAVDYLDKYNNNVKDINVITNYVWTFFQNTNLPCGGTSLSRLSLGADKALYQLQRCLYKSSGTTYEVTTPIPYTTTSTTAVYTTTAPNTTTTATPRPTASYLS